MSGADDLALLPLVDAGKASQHGSLGVLPFSACGQRGPHLPPNTHTGVITGMPQRPPLTQVQRKSARPYLDWSFI